MERSGIRGDKAAGFPYCAALHTGYQRSGIRPEGGPPTGQGSARYKLFGSCAIIDSALRAAHRMTNGSGCSLAVLSHTVLVCV